MGTLDEKRFKIGEVCRLAGVQPYVLRYWETEFPPLAPGKTGGGQRLYTQREIDIIPRIKTLLRRFARDRPLPARYARGARSRVARIDRRST